MEDKKLIRLSKRMVALGLCSRREADLYITQGQVKVDGQIVSLLGSRVDPEQAIELVSTPSALAASKLTLLLNKPAGRASSWRELVQNSQQSPLDRSPETLNTQQLQGLQAFGASLDQACGLLILTQDRNLASHIEACEVEFLVNVAEAPPLAQLKSQLDSLRPMARAPIISRQSDRQLRWVIHQPKAGELAALCQRLGCPALSMRCSRIGRLALGKLAPGEWRYRLKTDQI